MKKNINLLFTYFYWLSFISLVLVLTDAFSCLDLVRRYAFYWFDVVLTYAFLVFAGNIETFLVALFLVLFGHTVSRMFNFSPWKYVQASIIILLMFAWVNILFRITRMQPDTLVLYATLIVLTLGVAWFYRRKHINIDKWFDDTTTRLRKLILSSIVLSSLLTTFLLVEPLIPLSSPPVVETTTGNHPNILLIFSDALAAHDMSLYGYPLPTTPHLEEETKNWLVFENAQSVSTNSVAEMPTTLTGRYPYFDQYSRYGDAVRESDGWLFLPAILKNLGYDTYWYGYLTAGFNHFFYGFDRPICRGRETGFYLSRTRFAFRATYQTALFPFLPKLFGLSGDQGLRISVDCDPLVDVQSILNERIEKDEQAPFFIYMHYDGVNDYPFPSGSFLGHFLPISEGLTDAQSQQSLQKQSSLGPYPPELQPDVDKLRLRYDEAVLNQDLQLFKLIQFLKEKGLYENTMIIISADHGFNFENGYMRYSTPLVSYNEHHVPLLVKMPNQTVYGRRKDLVSNVDIMPTILDAIGIKYPKNYLDGLTLLEEKSPDRLVYTRLASYGNAPITTQVATIQLPYKIVKRGDVLLGFNLLDDPNEKSDIFDTENAMPDETANALQEALDEFQSLSKALYLDASMIEAK